MGLYSLDMDPRRHLAEPHRQEVRRSSYHGRGPERHPQLLAHRADSAPRASTPFRKFQPTQAPFGHGASSQCIARFKMGGSVSEPRQGPRLLPRKPGDDLDSVNQEAGIRIRKEEMGWRIPTNQRSHRRAESRPMVVQKGGRKCQGSRDN